MKTLLFFISLILTACYQEDASVIPYSINRYPSDSISMEKLDIDSVSSLVVRDSSFFILDRLRKQVIRTSLSMNPVYRYGATGRGPSEFSDPFDLSVSDKNLMVIDFQKRSMMMFDHHLIPSGDISLEYPPFSIMALNDTSVWIGTFDFEFEDVYVIDLITKNQSLAGKSRQVDHGMEGITFHASNQQGTILRYRQYNHRLDVFDAEGRQTSFVNPARPERPELDPRSPDAPIFTSKIHHSGFVAGDRACVLSGDHAPRSQPMHCFSFDGTWIGNYVLAQDASMISVYSDSLLYTYSQQTNHIYVYNLGF